MPPSLSGVQSTDACLHLRVLLGHTFYVDKLRSVGQEYYLYVGQGKINTISATARWIAAKTPLILCIYRKSEYDQEMPLSHTAEQPMVRQGDAREQ